MKNNQFLFEIYSSDGKKYSEYIDELNVKTKSGEIGILKNHAPLVAFLGISTFNIIKDGEKEYFSVSGANLSIDKDKTLILAETFERKNELNKEKIMKAKEDSEKILSSKSKLNNLELVSAEKTLKKAINRLNLLNK